MKSYVLVFGTLVLGLSALTMHAAGPAAPQDWDATAAARYLDRRMDTWWSNSKVLQTGDGTARCLSCHTALPYALARPALRRTLSDPEATANERLMLQTVQRRVAAGQERQPYYDNSDDKKTESRGVEAVINAFVLSAHDRQSGQAVSADTAAAFDELWAAQRPDGAWNWLNFGLEPYEAPDAAFQGATLAAMAVGSAQVRAEAPGEERLRQYLSSNVETQRLFNGAWALLAASRMPNTLSNDQRTGLVTALKTKQRVDGGWSLSELGAWRWNAKEAPFAPPGATDAELLAASDGYATGLVVYALRETGVPAADPVIANGLAWLKSHQQPLTEDPASAPWRAYSLNFDREHGGPKGEPWRRMFMSDLATSFAVLALTD